MCPIEGCQTRVNVCNESELCKHLEEEHPDFKLCGRCCDGHGDMECVPLEELYESEYYEYVCGECHGYLLDNE